MNKRIMVLFLACMGLLVATVSYAQEAKKYNKDTEWKEVVKVTFKTNKRAAALAIIEDYFKPATAKSKISPPELFLEMYTGDYDLLMIWHMQGGVSDMIWETHPDDVSWQKALHEIAGSKEKGQKILDDYLSYIERIDGDIAMAAP